MAGVWRRVSRRRSRLMSPAVAVAPSDIPPSSHPRYRGRQGPSREATSQKYKSPQNPGRDVDVARLVDFGC